MVIPSVMNFLRFINDIKKIGFVNFLSKHVIESENNKEKVQNHSSTIFESYSPKPSTMTIHCAENIHDSG